MYFVFITHIINDETSIECYHTYKEVKEKYSFIISYMGIKEYHRQQNETMLKYTVIHYEWAKSMIKKHFMGLSGLSHNAKELVKQCDLHLIKKKLECILS